MKRSYYATWVVAIAFGLAGCTSLKVQTDHSDAVDFSEFQTFQYVDSDACMSADDPFAHERMVAAIRAGMESSGFTETDSDPDLKVSYFGSVDEQTQFRTTYTSVGGWGRRGRMGVGVSGATTTPVTISAGTLVIDVSTAGERQLIWRGQVSDNLTGNRERNLERMRIGVERAFSDFPPN